MTVSSKMFGDPCPGTVKYLEVQYHCTHGELLIATLANSESSSTSTTILPLLSRSKCMAFANNDDGVG